MSGRFLLGTNIVIASLSADPNVVGNIEDADEYFISATVLGEMVYGACNSANPRENADRIDSFLAKAGFLSCDQLLGR